MTNHLTWRFFLILLPALLAACSNSMPAATPSEPSRQDNESSTGVLLIAERDGKRELDAWFLADLPDEADQAVLWRQGNNHCQPAVLTTAARDAAEAAFAALIEQPEIRSRTVYAGDSISLTSRTGTFATLVAHTRQGNVVYNTDDRWLVDELPEDTVLTVPGSVDFPAFESISVSPLTQIVQLTPEEGDWLQSTDTISWEPSLSDDDQIELHISGVSRGESGIWQSLTLRCVVEDSGSIQLPPEVINELTDAVNWTVDLARLRVTTHVQEDSTLTVVQLSQP